MNLNYPPARLTVHLTINDRPVQVDTHSPRSGVGVPALHRTFRSALADYRRALIAARDHADDELSDMPPADLPPAFDPYRSNLKRSRDTASALIDELTELLGDKTDAAH